MDRQNEIDNTIEIDLRDLLMEVLSFWKIIVLVAALVGAIAFAISEFWITPMYESTSELYVLTKSTSITSLADIQAGTSLTNDYIVVTKERPVLDQVISNLGLDETYDTLEKRVSLNNPSNSRLLEITVTDSDPNRAKEIADEIADVAADFIAAKMEQDPPQVTHYGYVNTIPVTPNIIKNTVLGVFAGGIVAVLIVVVTYLFNDTISGPEDIEKKLGLNVLGTLPLEETEDDGEKGSRGKKRKSRGKAHENTKVSRGSGGNKSASA